MLLDRDARTRPQRRRVSDCESFRPAAQQISHRQYHLGIMAELEATDLKLARLLKREYQRQSTTLQLIAAENLCSRAVLGALGSVMQNKTTEGAVGKRYHGGCDVADAVETLAVERAQQVFQAQYANVQAHSGTTANHIVLTALLERDDKILSLGLDQGGHVSHGAPVSFTGKFFAVDHYGVDQQTCQLDYSAIAQQAQALRPKLIICGSSAYTRCIDFSRFRSIADSVGAYLLADVSHIAGLIAAGAHPSPIDHAHFTTTSTYKPGGPRGGLILMGRDHDLTLSINGKERSLAEQLDKTTFPGVQGTPYLNNIAAKAVFFREMMSPEYRAQQYAIIDNAQTLAQSLTQMGFTALTGGTDTHMILVDASRYRHGLTGLIAQKSLEECGIVVNMNRLPFDSKGQSITSGLRLGTPVVTRLGMQAKQMQRIAEMVKTVLDQVQVVSDTDYRLDESFALETSDQVRELCQAYPLY
jgi:glycine hydroxymethyltransferase